MKNVEKCDLETKMLDSFLLTLLSYLIAVSAFKRVLWRLGRAGAPPLQACLSCLSYIATFPKVFFLVTVLICISDRVMVLAGYFVVDFDRQIKLVRSNISPIWSIPYLFIRNPSTLLLLLVIVLVSQSIHLIWLVYRQYSAEVTVLDWEQHAVQTDSLRHNLSTYSRTDAVSRKLTRLCNARRISPVLLYPLGYCYISLRGWLGLNDLKMPICSELNSTTNVSREFDNWPVDYSLADLRCHFVYEVVTVAIVTFGIIALIIYAMEGLRNPVQDLLNLCGGLNCGIFVRTYRLYGYYISPKLEEAMTSDCGNGNRHTPMELWNDKNDLTYLKTTPIVLRVLGKFVLYLDKFLSRNDSHTLIQTYTVSLPGRFDWLYRELCNEFPPETTAERKARGGIVSGRGRCRSKSVSTNYDNYLPHDLYLAERMYHSRIRSRSAAPRLTSCVFFSTSRKEDRMYPTDSYEERVPKVLRTFLSHRFLDANYVIRWPTLPERVSGSECNCDFHKNHPSDLLDFLRWSIIPEPIAGDRCKRASEYSNTFTGVMHYDPNMAFRQHTFLGQTFNLFIFEMQLFSVVAICPGSYGAATICVLLVSVLMSHAAPLFRAKGPVSEYLARPNYRIRN